MGRFYLPVVLGLCLIGEIQTAGYIGKRPASQGQCHYQNINSAHFSYDRNDCEGPSKWCEVHECWSTCGSEHRQSPINIDTHQAKREYFDNIQLWNKHKRVPAIISNNGHSPHFDVHVDKVSWFNNIILTNVPYRGNKQFIFAQLHIHVGKQRETDTRTKNRDLSGSKVNNHEGSEHSIDNKFYPMEVKDDDNDDDDDDDDDRDDDNDEKEGDEETEDEYNDEKEDGRKDRRYTYSRDCSSNNEDKNEDEYSKKCYNGHSKCKVRFAKTLSYLMEKYYEEIREHNPIAPEDFIKEDSDYPLYECGDTPDLDFFYSNCMKNNPDLEEHVQVDCGISPTDVLPYDQRFYTYAGSLTTPPCYETVQWIVFKCPIKVSKRAFENLKLVKDSHNDPLQTYGVRRPLQRNHINISKNF
ncbi:nacrein-like protein [Saccostrea cucullata]|uniref:nacrein-like protein n=1 Tax=Saccostrea cuccullata TaxID=36930 RepID=UPI002ED62254